MGEVSLYGLGSRTTVSFPDDATGLEDAIRHAWSRCLARSDDPLDSEPVRIENGPADDETPESLLQHLTQQVTYAKIHAQAGRALMLHAGAVAHPRTGVSLAFVAPGGTGKTTLMRHLGNRYGYLTDETVAVTADGVVLPYPKPLSIRVEASNMGKTETSPDDLRLRLPPAEAVLHRIVLLARSDDHAGPPEVDELSPFEAIAALAPETSSLSALPRPLHWLADLLDRLEPTVRLRCRDAHSAMDVASAWLEAR